jgi:hypothetical protein
MKHSSRSVALLRRKYTETSNNQRIGINFTTEKCLIGKLMERVKGIEPSYEAWEAAVLPLNYTRDGRTIAHWGLILLQIDA